MKEDLQIKGQDTTASKMIVTHAESAYGHVFVQCTEAWDRLVVILQANDSKRVEFSIDEPSARLLRCALNRFAEEDQWDTETK
jgi:hypothetical protein